MSAPELDDSRFPIVQVKFGKELTLDDVVKHRDNFTKLVDRRGPVVSIALIDDMPFRSMDAGVRKALAADADALGERGAFLGEFVVAYVAATKLVAKRDGK
jgi:hypothetical protein